MAQPLAMGGRQFKRSISNDEIFEQGLDIRNMLYEYIQKTANSSTVYKKSFDEETKKNRLNEIMQKLSPCVENIDNCVEDVHELIFELGLIMGICQEIIDLIDENDQEHKYLLRLSILVHDLIKKVKAERFKFEEISIVKKALQTIIRQNVTKEEVIKIDIELMDKGLNWIIG